MAISHSPKTDELVIRDPYWESRWYAAYTCPNHEKRVAEHLGVRSVEHFLPLFETVRQWKDRKVLVKLPLFPGYVFVRLALRDQLRVLQVPSVVRFVSFQGTPAALSDDEIQSLRKCMNRSVRAEPCPYTKIGERVRVIRGPLQGFEGILLRKKGRLHVVLSVELIQRSVLVEVDADEVIPLGISRNNSELARCNADRAIVAQGSLN